jgi:hypothetical protein
MEKKDTKYGGLIDDFIDNILERYGVTDELAKNVTKIIDGITKNIEVREIGDETYITIHLDRINFKFKKG